MPPTAQPPRPPPQKQQPPTSSSSLAKASTAVRRTVKIRENYVPKAQRIRQQLAASGSASTSAVPSSSLSTSTLKSICPKCQQPIPINEMTQHIRIELLDPKWKEQKEREISRKRESNLMLERGGEVAASLSRLATYRPDIFGGDDDDNDPQRQCTAAVREDQIRRDQEVAKQRAQAAWDGHQKSIPSVMKQAQRLPENAPVEQLRRQYEQAQRQIGPASVREQAVARVYAELKAVEGKDDDEKRPAGKRVKLDDQ